MLWTLHPRDAFPSNLHASVDSCNLKLDALNDPVKMLLKRVLDALTEQYMNMVHNESYRMEVENEMRLRQIYIRWTKGTTNSMQKLTHVSVPHHICNTNNQSTCWALVVSQ